MSPFLVYLMFQADDFVAAFFVFALVLGLASVPLVICSMTEWSIYSWTNKEQVDASQATCRKAAKWTVAGTILFASLAAITPSTKAIAAMVVLPKLTSPQALDTMGSEARDVYKLAKQALANLADDGHKRTDATNDQ